MNGCGRARLASMAGMLIGLLLVCIITGFVQAAPANPDSITLHTVRVFENIFETDDMLFVISYDVEYAAEPSEPADETFLMAIYDTDGTTLLFERPLNYYQYNVHSIYLDADNADTLTWDSEYRVRVMGNPVYFPATEDTTMDTVTLSPATHWISGTMANSREYLTTHCLDLAATLEDQWSMTLIVSTAEGQRLNSTGRTTFLDAIPNLDSALSELFQVSIETITVDPVAYNGTYEADTTISSMLGSQVAASFSGLGDWMGISEQSVGILWILFLACSIAGIVFLSTGNTAASLVLTGPVLIFGAWSGALPMALVFCLVILVVIYMVYHLWVRGA